MTPPESQDQPIPTPRCNLAFDGDLSVGLQPEIKTWEEAKKFSRTLERELILKKENCTEQRMQFNSQILDLQAERDNLLSAKHHMDSCRVLLNVPDDEVLHEAIAQLMEERDRLRQVLEPFANYHLEGIDAVGDGTLVGMVSVPAKIFKEAKKALNISKTQ